MARGWESKSVETQQEMAEERKARPPVLPPEEQERASQLRHLQLSLQRTVEQIEIARDSRRVQQLELARSFLEKKIEGLKEGRLTTNQSAFLVETILTGGCPWR